MNIDDIEDTPDPLRSGPGCGGAATACNSSLARLAGAASRPQAFSPARGQGAGRRVMLGIHPYYRALVGGHEYRDATGDVQLPAMPASRPLQALLGPILAGAAAQASRRKDPPGPIRCSTAHLSGKLLHRYDEVVLGHSAMADSAHSRYCYRVDIFNGSPDNGPMRPQDLKDYVAAHNHRFAACGTPGSDGRCPIREVLLSGGDPMALSNRHLYQYMAAAAEAGVHLVRICTKEMAFRPQRFNANLSAMLSVFHRRFPDVHLNVVVHFTHPDEMLHRDAGGAYVANGQGYFRWLPAVRRALDVVQCLGFVTLENQTPIISRVNDNALALRILQEELRRNGIRPKYLFQCREVDGLCDFAVPVEKAWALHNEAQRGLSDTARSRFTMSTEWGKLEVVSVIDGPAAPRRPSLPPEVSRLFGDGLVVMKVHRSPAAEESQGDLLIAHRNPEAVWISDYEDRIIYDGRLAPQHKYQGYVPRDRRLAGVFSLPRRGGSSCAM